jgi:hypothetical protein
VARGSASVRSHANRRSRVIRVRASTKANAAWQPRRPELACGQRLLRRSQACHAQLVPEQAELEARRRNRSEKNRRTRRSFLRRAFNSRSQPAKHSLVGRRVGSCPREGMARVAVTARPSRHDASRGRGFRRGGDGDGDGGRTGGPAAVPGWRVRTRGTVVGLFAGRGGAPTSRRRPAPTGVPMSEGRARPASCEVPSRFAFGRPRVRRGSLRPPPPRGTADPGRQVCLFRPPPETVSPRGIVSRGGRSVARRGDASHATSRVLRRGPLPPRCLAERHRPRGLRTNELPAFSASRSPPNDLARRRAGEPSEVGSAVWRNPRKDRLRRPTFRPPYGAEGGGRWRTLKRGGRRESRWRRMVTDTGAHRGISPA